MFHDDTSRFKVIICHRRLGKTYYALQDLIRSVLTCTKPRPRGLYCCPLLNQAKKVAWDYLIEFTKDIPNIKVNRQDLSVDFPNGGRVTLGGANLIDNFRGQYFDAIILDEVAQMSPSVWTSVLRPCLSDRLGSCTFIGTPKGEVNLFADLYNEAEAKKNWSRYNIKVDETDVLDQDEIAEARLDMSASEFLQEYMGSFAAAIRGAYYADDLQESDEKGRICEVEYQKDALVHTICDLGQRHAFAIIYCQFIGANQIHIIDHDEFFGMGLAEVFRHMDAKGYKYGDHIAPHDIRVKEIGTGMTRLEQAKKLGVRYKICKNIDKHDGRSAVKAVLPRVYFDRVKCKNLLDALRQHHSEYDEKKRKYSDDNVDDWTADSADAMRYMAVHYGAGKNRDLFQDRPDYSRQDRRTI